MNDLFEDHCPCCGQAIPEKALQASPFDVFWADVPHKIGKQSAMKAWRKLSTQDRKAAHDGVKRFYAWFASTYPTASPLHPSSYLTGKRWQDETGASVKVATHETRLENAGSAIRSGKRFLCTQIPAAIARDCVAAGLVTPDQCRSVCVL